MEKIEMVEKLQEKTGISAEVAWSALEKNNWVLVDAMLWLERENYIASQTAAASSASDAGQFLPVKPAVGGKKTDDSIGAKLRRLLEESLEHSLVLRRGGKVVLRVPVLILVILLCAAFYVVVIGLLAALFFGCQFALEGPHIKEDHEVNKAMKAAEEAAAKMKEEMSEKGE
ncbi:MAG: DUF4342 domain-containing protein [Clostridia bacterium]|nr:DUF4342 domain-containing protein [Clostridia bacterium]